jgi:hypothetical protein
MLLELELLLQREGRDGSFDAAASLNNSGHFADGYAVRKRRSRATEPVHRHHQAGHDNNSMNRCSRGEWHASSQWAMCGSG